MSYKSDLEAAHARIKQLENELKETKAALDQSEGLTDLVRIHLHHIDNPPNKVFLGDVLGLGESTIVTSDNETVGMAYWVREAWFRSLAAISARVERFYQEWHIAKSTLHIHKGADARRINAALQALHIKICVGKDYESINRLR
jgi:hypothetical protein